MNTETKLYVALGVLGVLGGSLYLQNKKEAESTASHSQGGQEAALPKLDIKDDDIKAIDKIVLDKAGEDGGAPVNIELTKSGEDWKLTKPMTLYTNRTRPMWVVEEDLTGENYCGGGYCSEHLNMMRYGDKGKGAPNCQENLEKAVRGYGMDRWSFNIDACFNVFMTVAYDADGKWEIRLPKGKPGDYMIMTALMPQIVAISNCPILFNACNNYKLKPLTLEILK